MRRNLTIWLFLIVAIAVGSVGSFAPAGVALYRFGLSGQELASCCAELRENGIACRADAAGTVWVGETARVTALLTLAERGWPSSHRGEVGVHCRDRAKVHCIEADLTQCLRGLSGVEDAYVKVALEGECDVARSCVRMMVKLEPGHQLTERQLKTAEKLTHSLAPREACEDVRLVDTSMREWLGVVHTQEQLKAQWKAQAQLDDVPGAGTSRVVVNVEMDYTPRLVAPW